jgi:hypothetical protein
MYITIFSSSLRWLKVSGQLHAPVTLPIVERDGVIRWVGYKEVKVSYSTGIRNTAHRPYCPYPVAIPLCYPVSNNVAYYVLNITVDILTASVV